MIAFSAIWVSISDESSPIEKTIVASMPDEHLAKHLEEAIVTVEEKNNDSSVRLLIS